MKLLIMLSFIVSLKSCCATKTMAIQENNLMSLNGTYQVKTLNSKDVTENKLSISFNEKEQRVSGFSGCNRFSGTYSLENGLIKIGPLASTKMFCGEKENNIEFEMQKALSNIDEVILTDSLLQLLSEKKVVIKAVKNKNKISFNYSAISRGTFLDINITDSIISISKDRKAKPILKSINSESWNNLITLLETINLDSISNLKAPTEARFYDGASIGKLEVTKNGTVYESSTFDHGKPPADIELLVKEILSLSENIE